MPSRSELELMAGSVNINPASYPNDSNLQQAIVRAQKLVVTGATSTTIAPTAQAVASTSGGAQV